ncbi:type I pantothenate kinase [Weissella halotolerans]|nr:type I pantothenate kinase [Weissella halotolerans]
MNYAVFPRAQWKTLGTPNPAIDKVDLDAAFLAQIKAFNDQISMGDVREIYVPLVKYIMLRYRQYLRDRDERQFFLDEASVASPFVIGIAGSVAVGKTTTAQLLQYLLQQVYGKENVNLTTTDGFLRSNADLAAAGLSQRKGFPESYDMPALLRFLDAIKDGAAQVSAPVYSHDISDVLAGETETFKRPKIFIIEGINTLQASPSSPVYLADYFDFSIYLDAETDLIEHWYLDRFVALLKKTAQANDPENYFYQWTKMPLEEALNRAKEVFEEINLPNLNHYILPTRERADLILHKTVGHIIDQVWLRKF